MLNSAPLLTWHRRLTTAWKINAPADFSKFSQASSTVPFPSSQVADLLKYRTMDSCMRRINSLLQKNLIVCPKQNKLASVYSAQHSTHPAAPTPTWSNCQWAKPSSGEPFSLTPLSHGPSEGSPAGAATTLRAARDRYNGVIRKLKCAGRVQVISWLEFPILDVMDT